MALIKQLLEGFLTAFAISTGVSLFIMPVSSRSVVLKEHAGYIQMIRGTLKAQTAYLQSLETSNMFASAEAPAGDDQSNDDTKQKLKKEKKYKSHPAQNTEAIALRASLSTLKLYMGSCMGT